MPPEIHIPELTWHRTCAGLYFATTMTQLFRVELEEWRVAVIERSAFGSIWWWSAWEPDGSRDESGRTYPLSEAKADVAAFFARRRGGEP